LTPVSLSARGIQRTPRSIRARVTGSITGPRSADARLRSVSARGDRFVVADPASAVASFARATSGASGINVCRAPFGNQVNGLAHVILSVWRGATIEAATSRGK